VCALSFAQRQENDGSVFESVLYADVRFRENADAQLWENEVDPAMAPEVRLEILNVIADDDSLEYARNMILLGAHGYGRPNDCKNTGRDRHAFSLVDEDERLNNANSLCFEIMNDINMIEKVNQLMGIIAMQGPNRSDSKRALEEVERLEADLKEIVRMNAELNDALAERERELERLRKELNDEGDDEVMTVQQLVFVFCLSLWRDGSPFWQF